MNCIIGFDSQQTPILLGHVFNMQVTTQFIMQVKLAALSQWPLFPYTCVWHMLTVSMISEQLQPHY